MEITDRRPWWTSLLVVDYLCGVHLLVVFTWAAFVPDGEQAPLLLVFVLAGVPVNGLAILVGWGVLAASRRRPGRRPAVDALIAAGVGLLVAPVLTVPVLVAALWLAQ